MTITALLPTVLFFYLITTVTAIIIDTCNCTLPNFKGTIDLSDPDYCTHPAPVSPPTHVEYSIIARNKDPITWTGYACTQWLSQKQITTNFLLAHDTTFTKQVLKVSPEECWKSARYPQMCDTNPMTKDGNTLKCLQQPNGEGQWMTKQSFTAKNCVTQIITLKKECHNCRVTSPFGILTNSSNDEFATHNDLTIVWNKPDPNQEPECDFKTIWFGKGNLTNGVTQSKLEDSKSQLEMIFHNNSITLCTNETAYPVSGVPDTYIKISNHPSRKKRHSSENPTGIMRLANATQYCISLPILQDVTTFHSLTCGTSDNMETEDEFHTTTERGQNMILFTTGIIMMTNEQHCIHAWNNNFISVESCAGGDPYFEIDTWILTANITQNNFAPLKIIHTETNLCLTAKPPKGIGPQVYLSNCTDSPDQFFIFEKISQNKIMQAIAPKIHEINSQNLNLADDRSSNNPSHPDFPTIPQFHGTITSEAVPEYCLTLPTTDILTIGKCRTNTTIGTFPIQKFAYHDGYLTTREDPLCITPQKSDNCTSSDKWTYNPRSKTLQWDNKCIVTEEKNKIRFLSNITCPHTLTDAARWSFQHVLKNDQLPQQIIPELKSLTSRRFKRVRTKPEIQNQSKPSESQQNLTETQPQSTNISNADREILAIENRQYVDAQATAHETKLANEIRQIYCKITTIQRNQALLLAQSNGLLAAQALNLKKCSRVSGSGSTLTLQQCTIVPIQLTAKLTACGYQPFFQGLSSNFTIGKDGWSLHPFQECFWSTEYVSLNGLTYKWINDDWKVEEPSIHLTKLNLVNKFEDIPLKAYDYLPHHHSIYDANALEQTNVLADLISRIQLSNTNSLSSLVLDKKTSSNFLDASNWTNIFKYGLLALASFIFSILLLYVIIFCIPFNKIFSICKRKPPTSEMDIELTTPLRQQQDKQHNHSHTIIDPIKGLCWNDGCVIVPPSAPTLD